MEVPGCFNGGDVVPAKMDPITEPNALRLDGFVNTDIFTTSDIFKIANQYFA